MFKYVLPILLLPALAFAECNHMISVPYFELEPGTSQLALVPIDDDLEEQGVLHWIAYEVGGNRAIVCLIMQPEKSKWTDDLRDLLLSNAGATHIDRAAVLRNIFAATLYRRMIDPVTGTTRFQDGREGRPLRTKPTSSANLYKLRQAGRDWRKAYNRRNR